MFTKEILNKLIDQELQSRKKPSWSSNRIGSEKYKIKNFILGRCSYCPKELAKTSKSFCIKHLKSIRDYQNKRILKLRKEKKCKNCECSLNEMDISIHLCGGCLDKTNLTRQLRS
jgi:hypothetical protein|tara:strand:- start:1486 stop:1830 length:345 start_codon:yes stop_codon:yes gene_type:complete